MSSNFSDRLKLELMATGGNANTWGTNTNNNLNVLDAFSGGYLSKSVAGSANITLSTANADPAAEASNKVIEFTGALTGDIIVFLPAVENNYVFFNNTSGSQTLTIAATGHTANGIQIAQSAYSHIYCEGSSNFKMFNAIDKIGATTVAAGKDLTAGGGNIILRSNGAVTATTFLGSGANLTGVDPFPSGTKQVFYQASAPTGWTQDTAAALGNAAMRVVVGTGGGTGGSDTFQTTFGSSRTTEAKSLTVSGSVSGTVGGHTLSTPELASHSHTVSGVQFDNESPNKPKTITVRCNYNPSIAPISTSSTGGGGSHSHPFSGTLGSATTGSSSFAMPDMDLKFANVIIAAKD